MKHFIYLRRRFLKVTTEFDAYFPFVEVYHFTGLYQLQKTFNTHNTIKC